MKFENVAKLVNSLFTNTVSLTVMRIVLVLVLVFMTQIPRSSLVVFENIFFQVFYLALMAFVALMDAPTGLLMAAVYLFAVQQLNRTKPASISRFEVVTEPTAGSSASYSNSLDTLTTEPSYQKYETAVFDKLHTQTMLMDSESDPSNFYVKQDSRMDNRVNQLTSTSKFESFENTMPEDTHPAYKTMTENIAETSKMFTTPQQFRDAQTNEIGGINQREGIKVWESELSAQGFDLPNGFDAEDYRGSPFGL
jgi:hypothetical protein